MERLVPDNHQLVMAIAMTKSYRNIVDATRDPRRQPPIKSEGDSTHTKHAETSSTSLFTNTPPLETSTDNTPIPSTPDQVKTSPGTKVSPGTAISPGPKSNAAEAVALMRRVPVRKTPSPEKRGSLDKKLQNKPAAQESTLVTAEKKEENGQQEKPVAQLQRSLHMDTQLRDSELEVQCVRGEGNVLVRHQQQDNLEDAQRPAAKTRIPDQKFPVNWCWSKVYKVSRRSMRWIADLDGFEIRLDGEEKLTIHAEAVSSISYNIDHRKFYLAPKPNTSTEKHLEELVLKVGGNENTPFKLRSILEQRFGAVKVTRCDPNFFIDKERTFQHYNLFSVPPRSTSQPEAPYKNSSDGLEEGVVEDLNSLDTVSTCNKPVVHASKLLGENTLPWLEDHQTEHASDFSGESPNVVQESIALVKRKVDKSKNPQVSKGKRKFTPLADPQNPDASPASTQPPKDTIQQPAAKSSIGRASEKPNSGCGAQVMQAVVVNRVKPPVDEVAPTPDSGVSNEEIGPERPKVNYPIGMYFRSGERVRINDLVVRVRDDETMAEGKNKLDKHDIYDGPFRIIEIPGPIETSEPSTDVRPDGNEGGGLPPTMNEDQLAAMRQKKVKLHFPQGSTADPWTKLGRIRPVYHVYPEVPDDLEPRAWYYWPKANKQERKIMNTEDMGADVDDEVLNTRGVCHMQKGFYTKVQYVATSGLEADNVYEVEKLRDKIIERLPRKDFPDETMDDPNIVRYLEEEAGVLPKSEVLVVKYLVHWAGWPSEDDTYERAQDNIPQSFINEYEAVAGNFAGIPEPARKRRKSETKRYFS